MKFAVPLLSMCILFVQASISHSEESINIVVLPETYDCHQVGAEFKVTKNSTLGVLGVVSCDSDRPTYGSSNNNVKNSFSRVLIPWRYSMGGAFENGYFVQSMIGMEAHEFRSTQGSRSDVSFVDLTLHGGYQWFWSNGFNVSALGGVNVLVKSSSDEHIVQNERTDVVDFIDKNTKSNIHPGLGVILGWKF